MHMRTKKWAKPELAVCPYFTDEPETKRGHWREQFRTEIGPLYLELGTRQGRFHPPPVRDDPAISTTSRSISPATCWATRAATWKQAFDGRAGEKRDDRRATTSATSKRYFAPEDRVERIYINFCNSVDSDPATAKRRLTASAPACRCSCRVDSGGRRRKIWFKTDDTALFTESLCRISTRAALSCAI